MAEMSSIFFQRTNSARPGNALIAHGVGAALDRFPAHTSGPANYSRSLGALHAGLRADLGELAKVVVLRCWTKLSR
ncbi:MAG: hypothetical protein ACI9D0_001490 [Bacteroidia bacterium]|jgi:hypothetical protein